MANKGTFQKGDPRAGRKAGIPNKITAELREMILAALDDAGGQAYLTQQANENPQAFMSLLGRTLPRDLNLGGNLRLEVNLIGRESSGSEG